MASTVEHRAALAALHDALGCWLGVDEPQSFNHDVLGGAWLDVEGDGFRLNSIEVDPDSLAIVGGRSYSLDREHAATLVAAMVDCLLSGNVEVGDALKLRAQVNQQVGKVIRGRHIERVQHAGLLAAYTVAAARRPDRGALASSIQALAMSEHDQLMEVCSELGGGQLTPAALLQGGRELDQLRLAGQAVANKLCQQRLDVMAGTKLYQEMTAMGVGVKVDSTIKDAADLRAESCKLCRQALTAVLAKVRDKLNALTGEIIVVQDYTDLHGDALGQTFHEAVTTKLGDPNDHELPEITRQKINCNVDQWWNQTLAEAFASNSLRGVVLSEGPLFGTVVKLLADSNISAHQLYPVRM